MVNKLGYVIGEGRNPHENLALEKYLFDTVAEDEVILYLWQNRRTVVIGQNQNAWKECDVEAIAKDKGFVARRLSGGGAVYHDDGNLNFTFLMAKKNYVLVRQFGVIKRAMELLGFPVEISGRNDLTIEGKKFSGNAFYEAHVDLPDGTKEIHCYHHGTIMIDVDRDVLSRYLTPDSTKYTSKNVHSVKSRVANLKEFNPEITVEAVKEAMIAAFSDVYDLTPEKIIPPLKPAASPKLSSGIKPSKTAADMTPEAKLLTEYIEFFSSPEWILNSKAKFDVRFTDRFGWGDIDIRLSVKDGLVTGAEVYSDAMDETGILSLKAELNKLIGSQYAVSAVASAASASSLAPYICADILKLIN